MSTIPISKEVESADVDSRPRSEVVRSSLYTELAGVDNRNRRPAFYGNTTKKQD